MGELADDIKQLAELVGAKTGKTAEQAVREALEHRARQFGIVRNQVSRRKTPDEIKSGLREIAARCSALPVYDTRSADEILGYNEDGLFS